MGGLTTRQLESRKTRQNRSRSGQLQAGDTLQGRYRVVGTLGTGGFSSVYQARDMRFPNVTKLCAVKEMVNLAPDPKMRELASKTFEREASILATLDHPAIVDVYDYFSEDDRSYLVLEFIRGRDLESLLAETNEFFPQEQVLDWGLQVCEVLDYLHSQKPDPIIFRDLKPSNLMLDPHGRIRLIDFNIAKVFQSEEKNTTIGTEGYAPPEQYRGEASPAGDVYGLGATLHHLLTRQDPRLEPPFSFHERPIHAANPNVSPALEQIVMRCVAYNAPERFPDATEVRAALKRLVRTTNTDGLTLHTDALDALSQATSAAAKEPVGAAGEEPPAAERERESARTPVLEGSTVSPIWVFKCEDEIRSMPVVANGTVYVGVYDNNLYALNAFDGTFRWKFPASDIIAASPAVYGESIFVGSADSRFYSINNRIGRLNWRFETEGPIYSSPKAKFDHVFFGSDDNHLYAVNTSTGRMAWKSNAFHPVRSSPFVADEYVYCGSEGGYVFCVDLSGTVKWQFQARRGVTSSPIVVDEMIFFGSMDGMVYALDANTGWAIWRFRTQRSIISSPAVHDGTLYIGSADGNLYAIETGSGRKLWQFETRGQVPSSPVVSSNSVYFGSTDGIIYSVDSSKGRLQWRFQTGGMVISSPFVADDVLYIGSTDKNLYALPV